MDVVSGSEVVIVAETQRVSHETTRRRKALAAELLKNGKTEQEVVDATGLSVRTVNDLRCYLCIPKPQCEHGIASSTYAIIADLCNTSDTYGAIAGKHGVTFQRIQQIHARCVEHGIPVKTRKGLTRAHK